MKAMIHTDYGDPQVLGLQEVETPIPKDNEVIVEVKAAGVNWADWSMVAGMPYVMRLGYGFRHPRDGSRGSDLAGVVAGVGRAVSDFAIGDEVFGWGKGTFAEYARARESGLIAKPAEITFEEAAALPMAGMVALQALRDVAGLEPGQKVLVNGASGGIGSFAVQIAKAMGGEVTGVCSTDNLEMVEELGADHVIDYSTTDFTQGDVVYDVILDIADTHTIDQRLRVLSSEGTLIPNSGHGGPWFGSVGRILRARMRSPLVSQKIRPFLSLPKKEDLLALVELIREGKLRPIVGRTFALTEVPEAVAYVGDGHVRGKAVVVP